MSTTTTVLGSTTTDVSTSTTILVGSDTTTTTTTTLAENPCEISHTFGYIAIAVVFCLSVFGTLLPAVIHRFRPHWDVLHHPFFRYWQGVAAGFVIAVALVHSFPDAASDLSDPANGLPDFAWAGLFALLGLLATWTCEAFISVYLKTSRPVATHDIESAKLGDSVELANVAKDSSDGHISTHKHGHKKGHKHDHGHSHGSVSPSDSANEGHCDHALEQVISREMQTKDYTAMIILLFGLTFHSVFVGFAIGLDNSRNLFIAVLAHQFFEALAIGFHIVRTSVTNNFMFLSIIVLVFACSAPVGCGIGIGVSYSICNSPSTFSIISGVFNALASGILIYVGTVHMRVEEFSKPDVQNSRLKSFILWLGVVTGMALMSVIGIWA